MHGAPQGIESPATIGKYRVIGVLGKGAMGIVYKAEDPEIGRIVAIKTLHSFRSTGSGGTQGRRFALQREARSAGNLRHPGIVTVFEINRSQDLPFIVMDYIEGEGFEHLLARKKALPPSLAIHYLAQIAAGLDYAHSRGVLHCDVKPSNILVDAADTTFILDFGVSHIIGSRGSEVGGVIGTPTYMSPEQILNDPLTSKSDLFSLGIIAFECFTGMRPFPGNDFPGLIKSVIEGRRRSMRELAPQLPPALEIEFERAIAREEKHRYASGYEMIVGFCRALKIDMPSHLIKRPRPRRNSLTNILAYAGFGGEPPLEPLPDLGPNSKNQSTPAAVPPIARLVSAPDGESRSSSTEPNQNGAGSGSHNNSQSSSQNSGTGNNGLASSRSQPKSDRFREEASAMQEAHVMAEMELLQRLVLLAGLFFLVIVTLIYLLMTSRTSSPQKQNITQDNPRLKVSIPWVGPQRDAMTIMLPDDIILSRLRDPQLFTEDDVLNALREARYRPLPDLILIADATLRHDSYLIRKETLATLASFKDARAFDLMVGKLDDYDESVRAEAAESLGLLGDMRAGPPLNILLIKEVSPKVRRSAAQALAILKRLEAKRNH